MRLMLDGWTVGFMNNCYTLAMAVEYVLAAAPGVRHGLMINEGDHEGDRSLVRAFIRD